MHLLTALLVGKEVEGGREDKKCGRHNLGDKRKYNVRQDLHRMKLSFPYVAPANDIFMVIRNRHGTRKSLIEV